MTKDDSDNSPESDLNQQVTALKQKVKSTILPQDLAEKILHRLESISRASSSTFIIDEIDRNASYIDWVVNLPWNSRTEDILEIEHAKKVLDKNHYGLANIKERVYEFIALAKLNKQKQNSGGLDLSFRAPILCFVGLVGTGKTTLATSIAEALGRKFYRIPLGGLGSVLDLRGQSKLHPEAEPGFIIKALRQTKVKNSVILLDEIDRVAEEGRSSVMGVLVELLDPEQNRMFLDYYIDYPFDLSEVMFIATANNTTNIATAVLDRLEVIQMPAYTDEEKIMIGQNYMFPKILVGSGLPEGILTVDDSLWPSIVRPLGYDAGMRTLERTIRGIVGKVAKEYVEGKIKNVHLTEENIRKYLPSF